MGTDEDIKKDKPEPVVIKNCTDLQRMRLEKLMKNPDKPVIIPERPKAKGVPQVPDFVRNVMGSSAGAGSGEFHVYRHLRRKEYARQKYMKEKGEREKLDEEYHKKLEANKLAADARTAKKRAKRLKKKQKGLKANKKSKMNASSESESGPQSEDESTSAGETEDMKSDDNERTQSRIDPEEESVHQTVENRLQESELSEAKCTTQIEAADSEVGLENKTLDLHDNVQSSVNT